MQYTYNGKYIYINGTEQEKQQVADFLKNNHIINSFDGKYICTFGTDQEKQKISDFLEDMRLNRTQAQTKKAGPQSGYCGLLDSQRVYSPPNMLDDDVIEALEK